MSDISLDTVLRLKHRFDFPVDRVYDAWSRPDAWKQWFCSPGEGYSGKMTEFEFEAGGTYRAEMRNPNDETVVQSGVFQAIEPHERLVMTHIWETSVFGDDVDYDETLVAVDFQAQGDASTVTITHLGFPSEAVRDEHLWGWEGCMEAMNRFLSSKASGQRPSF